MSKKIRIIKSCVWWMVRRTCIFLILLTIDGDTQRSIIMALAERQANGRPDIKPYTNAKRISKLLTCFEK